MGRSVGSSMQSSRRALVLVVVLVVVVFGWHLYLTGKIRLVAEQSRAKIAQGNSEASLSLNPITDVVEMIWSLPPPESDPKNSFAGLASQFATAMVPGFVKVVEPMAERELNTKARESFDLYAMILPYRLRITTKEPDAAAVERAQADRERQKAEEGQKRAAEERQRFEAELKQAREDRERRQHWQVIRSQSPIDDSPRVVLSVEARDAISGWLKTFTPILDLRCEQRRTEVYVVVGMRPDLDYGEIEKSTVTLRFDKDRAEKHTCSVSTGGEALFFPQPVPLIRKMLKHQTLLLQFIPFNASQATTTFDLSGLSEQLAELQHACGWQ